MTTTFPGAVDSLPRPSGSTKRNAGGGLNLSTVVDNISDAIEISETKIGISESSAQDTPVANTVLASSTNGKSKWRKVVQADIADGSITQSDQVDGTTSSANTTSTSYGTIADMTRTLTGLTIGNVIEVDFTGTFYHATTAVIGTFALRMDSLTEVGDRSINAPGSNYYFEVVLKRRFVATAASHTFTVRWKVASGTLNAKDGERTLIVKEQKK